ncbi:MAG TPA: diguanylate cyclase [Gemmatimonadales bacterium]|nr:diguanylate cyclase [Gemmatimonadales bacterium]
MSDLERAISDRLRLLGLPTIRRRILAFGVLATIIPSIITGTISYAESYRALTEKTTDQLGVASFQSAREVDLFFKERVLDLRVFANSYEVTESVDRLGPARSSGGNPAARRLTDYLKSVKVRSTDFEEIQAINRQGVVVASSSATPSTPRLPTGWLRDMGSDRPVFGDAFWDETVGKALVTVAVPVTRNDVGIGAIAGRVMLDQVATILRRFAPGDSGQVALVTVAGRFIVSSRENSAALMQDSLSEVANQTLSERLGNPVEFQDHQGQQAVGTLQQVPRLEAATVAFLPVAEAFQQVNRLRNVTILTVLSLLLVVGGLAYLFSLVLVRPVERLRNGAAKVAGGDLDVHLPVTGSDEVAYLTEVFNDMVRRLRESRVELERLSNTDGLTGLFNRRRLMEALGAEVARATREEKPCSLLMVDVDHFKQFNDAWGHPAGDAVLSRVATILQESIRTVDVAGRYGGEEFLLVLAETGMPGALEVADRVRARLASEVFDGGRITVSVGAATYPEDGKSAEALVMSADLALYQAKKEGRDRVVQATAPPSRSP